MTVKNICIGIFEEDDKMWQVSMSTQGQIWRHRIVGTPCTHSRFATGNCNTAWLPLVLAYIVNSNKKQFSQRLINVLLSYLFPAISPLLGIHEVIPVASFYTMEVEMSSHIIVHIPKISDLKVYIFIFFLLLFTLPYTHCHILCLNSENIWITSLSFISWILYSMGESSTALSIIGMMSLYACSILLADSFFWYSQ